MEPIIVAIELSTSRIAGIAGKRKDGNLHLLAYAEEPANGAIKRGIIYNMEKTTQALRCVMKKLQTQLNLTIEQVYVALAGQSLRSVTNTVRRDLFTPSYINQEQVDAMADENRNATLPDCEILESIPQQFRVDDAPTETPVGVQGLVVEGTYLNIIARLRLQQNIDTCFNNLGLTILERRLSPLALTNHLLVEKDKRAGCALVDIGAGTTTVVVCRNNKVRHLVTLPLGMNNVVSDLASLNIDDPDEAQQLIEKYANASIESIDDEYDTLPPNYTPAVGNPIPLSDIQFAIYARLKEIVDNVIQQIQLTPYGTSILGGITLTGGGARVRNLDKLFRQNKRLAGIPVRTAHTIITPITRQSTFPKVDIERTLSTTLLSLLADGTENCTGAPYDGNSIFDDEAAKEKREQVRRRQTQDEQEQAANAQRIETYKERTRTLITLLNAQAEALARYPAQKQIRKEVAAALEQAEEPFDDDDAAFLASVADTPQLKQLLNELSDLRSELQRKHDDLKRALLQANSDNTVLAKIRRALGRIVEE